MADEMTNIQETSTETVDYKAKFEEVQTNYERLKSNFDKVSSEVAEHKRKDKERMSDEQKRAVELEEREAYYKTIEKENALYKFKSSLSTSIKDDKVLNAVAEYYANGEIEEAIKKQNDYYAKYQAELEKTIKADLLQKNPQSMPQNDGNKPTMTRSQIMAIDDYAERQQKIAENIDLFN